LERWNFEIESQMKDHREDLSRIVDALKAAGKVYRSRSMASVRVERKSGGDPVTDAEREVNQLLYKSLVREGEGWFSEESADNADRLSRTRVWLVDPLDGTREYVSGVPEWCISIALLEEGELVAGGVFNPLSDELIYGSCGSGIVFQSKQGHGVTTEPSRPDLPLVLASRSECNRGEWKRFRNAPIQLRPMGSVAYKLALVAAGKADATWTLVPKHEWDVAAGVAILRAAGGRVLKTDGNPPSFNQRNPLLPGLVGFSASGLERLRPFLVSLSSDPAYEDCLPWVSALLNSKVLN
jgi:myo-inositol-1(or 4)-monophosphatase